MLTGAWMWTANQLAALFPAAVQGRAFLQVTMAMGAGCLVATLVVLARLGLPPQRLAWFAAAPTIVAYAFMNWDALPVLLATVALALHRHGRDAGAGIAAGLGAAAKLYPVLLVPLFVLARLGSGRPRGAAVTAGAAAGAWLAVNVPVALAAPAGWGRFLELSRTRLADHDSLYRMAEVYLLPGDARFPVGPLNLVTGALFLIAAVVIVVAGLRVRAAADAAELFLPLLIAFLLTSKVYSPQFSLWLLAPLALSLPRLRPFLVFCAADLAVFLTRFPWLGGRQGFTPAPGYGWFAAAIAARAVVLGWIAWVSVRERPAYQIPTRPLSPALRFRCRR